MKLGIPIRVMCVLGWTKKGSFLKRSIRGLGINQLILLHFWCITSCRRLLLRRLPGVELLDDLRVDTIQLLLREDAE